MHSFVLQDWITVRGVITTPGQIITQGESGWLDLAPYQDVSFWLDVREFTPPSSPVPTIVFQTSPIKEDGLFQNMVSPISLTLTPSNPSRVPITTSQTPVARYVRWQLQGTTSGTVWDVTFRVLVSADGLGL